MLSLTAANRTGVAGGAGGYAERGIGFWVQLELADEVAAWCELDEFAILDIVRVGIDSVAVGRNQVAVEQQRQAEWAREGERRRGRLTARCRSWSSYARRWG